MFMICGRRLRRTHWLATAGSRDADTRPRTSLCADPTGRTLWPRPKPP